MKNLFPPQAKLNEHLLEVLNTRGAALNASEMGTGKTLMSVEIARSLGKRPLVVSPKAVIPAWEETFQEQDVDYFGVINFEKLRTGNTLFGAWKGKPKRGNFQWNDSVDFLIVDEVHKSKSRQSQNASMLTCAAHISASLGWVVAHTEDVTVRRLRVLVKGRLTQDTYAYIACNTHERCHGAATSGAGKR